MRTMIKFIPCLLIAVFACDDNGTSTKDRLAFTKSELKWNEFKSQSGNSYVYETTFISFTGVGSTTEIRVEDGIVTARTFELFEYQNGERVITNAYQEHDEEVGTHDLGSKPLTIDQLYQKCGTEYLVVSREDNEVTFETGEDGIMSVCGYRPRGCVDDCFVGIRIDALEAK